MYDLLYQSTGANKRWYPRSLPSGGILACGICASYDAHTHSLYLGSLQREISQSRQTSRQQGIHSHWVRARVLNRHAADASPVVNGCAWILKSLLLLLGGLGILRRLCGLEAVGGRRRQQVAGRDQLRLGGRVQCEAETRFVEVGGGQEALGGDGLVGEEVAEDGQHALAVGGVSQVFLERRVGL